jgi:predicted nucleic acid-binding protein
VRCALDADVLIAALDRSDLQHRRARDLFEDWHRHGVELLVSAINLSEVLVGPAADPAQLRVARRAIAMLGVRCSSPPETVAVEAARLRARHPLSLADAYLLATAAHASASVASFDVRVGRAAAAEKIPLAAA